MTAAAEVAAERQQRAGCDIARIGAEHDSFDNIRTAADAAAHDERYIIADALIAQTLVDAGKRQLNRDTHVVADSGRRRARACLLYTSRCV